LTLVFHSCFLIKIPIKLTTEPIHDTVNVYHFIVTKSSRKLADTATTNSFVRESKKATDYLSKEANKHGQSLVFINHWVTNRDTSLKNNFIHKLPNNSLQILTRKKYFRIVTRKKTKEQEEMIERIDWHKSLFDSVSKQITDTSVSRLLTRQSGYNYSANKLIAFHLLKARKSKVLGLYERGTIYIGFNKSVTIAHEICHYLGAPDLYTHRYWFGKRRRLVKKKLPWELMDFAIFKHNDCATYNISDFIAYTLSWEKNIDKKFKPLLKENLMAKVVFYFGLFL
jgi:hypothetical protein